MPNPNLAYLDTFAGLVPCRVEYVTESDGMAHIVLTATRGAYKRGERLTEPLRDIVARQTHTRGGSLRVSSWRPLPTRVAPACTCDVPWHQVWHYAPKPAGFCGCGSPWCADPTHMPTTTR